MGRLKFCGRLTFFLQECGLTPRMPHKLSCVSLALPLIPPRCTTHHSGLYFTPPEWCHLPCGLDEHQADANIILYKPKNYCFFTVYPKYFSTLISSIKLAKRDDSSQNCPYSVTTAYVTVSAFPNKSILPKGPSTKTPEVVTSGCTIIWRWEQGTGGSWKLGVGDFHPVSLWNRQVAFHP